MEHHTLLQTEYILIKVLLFKKTNKLVTWAVLFCLGFFLWFFSRGVLEFLLEARGGICSSKELKQSDRRTKCNML